MSSNKLKKTIVFTSLANRTILEGVIRDISAVKRITESVALENALIDSLLPHNDNISKVVHMYIDTTVSETLTEIFGDFAINCSIGIDVTAAHPYVVFLRQAIAANCKVVPCEDHQLSYLHTQWDSIVDAVSGGDKAYCSALLHKLQGDATKFEPYEYVSQILYNWDTVCRQERTFRFLSFVSLLIGDAIPNNAANRTELRTMLCAN